MEKMSRNRTGFTDVPRWSLKSPDTRYVLYGTTAAGEKTVIHHKRISWTFDYANLINFLYAEINTGDGSLITIGVNH